MSIIKSFEWKARSAGAVVAVSAMTMLMAGCSGFTTAAAPATIVGPAITGAIHGGQQPVSGATFYLYAANTSGYGVANTNLLTASVTSGTDGSFNITSLYHCTAGQQMYLVAIGGDPGSGHPNPNAAQMTALGDCSTLTPDTFINMNEITTVGSVFALAPFMTSYAAVSTSPTNTSGLAHAFASVNKLVNISAGSATGSALPAGATAPTAEIITLADIMAACINSRGGVAKDQSACGNLFDLATTPGGAVPTDTVAAILHIAQNPTWHVGDLYVLATPDAPFGPRLNGAPHDWTMSINYTAGGFNAPHSTTIDAHGNVWVANSGNNTVTMLSQSGTPAASSPLSGNGLNAPAAVAIDANGNAWVANKGTASVSAFTSGGGTFGLSPFTGAGLSHPQAIAIDAPGNIWVANSGSQNLSELNGNGSPLQQVSTGSATPGSLAINPK
jgi:streptogramin lyase